MVWYLIVSFPDLCLHSSFFFTHTSTDSPEMPHTVLSSQNKIVFGCPSGVPFDDLCVMLIS